MVKYTQTIRWQFAENSKGSFNTYIIFSKELFFRVSIIEIMFQDELSKFSIYVNTVCPIIVICGVIEKIFRIPDAQLLTFVEKVWVCQISKNKDLGDIRIESWYFERTWTIFEICRENYPVAGVCNYC